jgi:hypothetical protein
MISNDEAIAQLVKLEGHLNAFIHALEFRRRQWLVKGSLKTNRVQRARRM